MNEISKGVRIINYVIDAMIIGFLTTILQSIRLPLLFLPALIYFFYYLILESIFGRTIGKFATGTQVRTVHNTKPNFWKILMRTMVRLTPIDGTSYLFGKVQGAHDILSGTRLTIEDK